MKRYLILFIGLMGFILLSFFLVNALEIPFLSDPQYLFEGQGFLAAMMSISLLATDVLFPIPSSIIMVANGAMFGAFLGSIVSMIGMLIATILGFFIGQKGETYLSNFVSKEEQATGIKLMNKWGILAIILTRSIPVLSESIIVMSGFMGMRFKQIIIPSILGLLPSVVIYAVTGAYAVNLESNLLSLGLVLLVTLLFWLISIKMKRNPS